MSRSARSLLPELRPDPVAAVRAGLPSAALERLQRHLQVSDVRLAPMLGVSPRTLRRRRETGTLTTDESDRLVGLAEVVALAHRAVDSAAVAREWLQAPHSVLGGKSPLDLQHTVIGMEGGTTMPVHVEHGMPASPSVLLNGPGNILHLNQAFRIEVSVHACRIDPLLPAQ